MTFELIPYVPNVVATISLHVIVETDGKGSKKKAKNMWDYGHNFSNMMKNLNSQREEYQIPKQNK